MNPRVKGNLQMIVLDEGDVVSGLRRAVSGKGAPYTYPSGHVCVYATKTSDGFDPQCLVGYALATLGVPLRLMFELGNQANAIFLASALSEHGFDLTPRAVQLLTVAQRIQDKGRSWGAALAAVERYTAAATDAATEAEIWATVDRIVHFVAEQSVLTPA
jgi:hypothetical protein